MEYDFSWLEAEGVNIQDGLGYTGGKDKYLSTLQRYLKGFDDNKKAVEETLAAGDLEGYAIKVHSLKSNSKMLGAAGLSASFEELELAAKRGDNGYVREHTGEVLAAYEAFIKIIKPVGALEDAQVEGELSPEDAKKTAEELLEALDDFDDELSAGLVSRLSGYPFRLTQKQKLKDASEFIRNFMYDEAAELIREIIPAIE